MEINIGDFVCCDFCNSDGEHTYGGVLIGSNAVCGKCCEKNGYYKPDFEYKDEIKEFFPKDKTFKVNVLDYRMRAYGETDGKIIIKSTDDYIKDRNKALGIDN